MEVGSAIDDTSANLTKAYRADYCFKPYAAELNFITRRSAVFYGLSLKIPEPVQSGVFRVPQFRLYLRNAKIILSDQTSQSSWFSLL